MDEAVEQRATVVAERRRRVRTRFEVVLRARVLLVYVAHVMRGCNFMCLGHRM